MWLTRDLQSGTRLWRLRIWWKRKSKFTFATYNCNSIIIVILVGTYQFPRCSSDSFWPKFSLTIVATRSQSAKIITTPQLSFLRIECHKETSNWKKKKIKGLSCYIYGTLIDLTAKKSLLQVGHDVDHFTEPEGIPGKPETNFNNRPNSFKILSPSRTCVVLQFIPLNKCFTLNIMNNNGNLLMDMKFLLIGNEKKLIKNGKGFGGFLKMRRQPSSMTP